MGGGGMMKRQLPVKVVIINTQYVVTDAVSFKSVVQSLTGKESTVATAATVEKPKLKSRNSGASAFDYNSNSNSNSNSNAIERVLERGVSFKDFDRMLKELPSLDELYTLYAEY